MSSSAVAGGTVAAPATGAGAPALGDQSSRLNSQHHYAHARTRSQSHSRNHSDGHRTRRASQPASHGPRPPSFLSAATTTDALHTQPGAPILQLSRKFVARRISEGETGRLKEELKCQACGKGYKHVSSLAKHLWEHTPEWNLTSKLLISKHQQVQLLEAASILVSMNEEDENVPASDGENDDTSANTTAVDESVDNDDSELSSRDMASSNTSPDQETAVSSGSSPDGEGEVDADGDVDVEDGERVSRFSVGHNSGRTIHKTPRRRSHLYSASPIVGSVLANDDGHQPPRASRRRSTFTRPRTLFGSQLHHTEIPENSVFELDD